MTQKVELISKEQWKSDYPAKDYPDSANAKEFTVHFLLVNSSEASVVKYLDTLKDRVKVVRADPKYGHTPLMIAIMLCKKVALEKLYGLIKEYDPSQLETADSFGWKPLHYAAVTSHKIYEWLIAQKADVTARTKRGATAEDLSQTSVEKVHEEWSAKGVHNLRWDLTKKDFLELPNEITIYAFSYLNHHDLMSVSAVCQQWHSIISDNEVYWKKKCIEKWKEKEPYRESWLHRFKFQRNYASLNFRTRFYPPVPNAWRGCHVHFSRSGELLEVLQRRGKSHFVRTNRTTNETKTLSSSVDELILFRNGKYFILNKETAQLCVHNLETLEQERSIKLELKDVELKDIENRQLDFVYSDNEEFTFFVNRSFSQKSPMILSFSLKNGQMWMRHARLNADPFTQYTYIPSRNPNKWFCYHMHTPLQDWIYAYDRVESKEMKCQLTRTFSKFLRFYIDDSILMSLDEHGHLHQWDLANDFSPSEISLELFENPKHKRSAAMTVYRDCLLVGINKELRIYKRAGFKLLNTVQLHHLIKDIYVVDELPVIVTKENERIDDDGDEKNGVAADYEYCVLDFSDTSLNEIMVKTMQMQWINNFSLFLFDFDGLLVNTEKLHFAAYQKMCERRGINLPWNYEQFCRVAHFQEKGAGIREAMYRELPDLEKQESNWDVLYEEKKKIYLELLESDELQLMPGVEDLLIALKEKNIKRAVATNATREQVDYIQKKLPILKTIPVWVTREDYDRPKPAPDAYLKAKEKLFEEGDRVIGFEDTQRGLKALLEAGVKSILVCAKEDPSARAVPPSAHHFTSFDSIKNLK